MDRTENEEYIIGCVSLLSNKITQVGDFILPDITFKQWFLLIMISKMELREKSINSIAEVVGTTRQNVKKMLVPLENKGYVHIEKSNSDARALKVELTEKAYQYFTENDASAARETNRLFSALSTQEIDGLACTLKKLLCSFEIYEKDGKTMNNVKPIYKTLNILLLLLTLFVTIYGICSFDTTHTYNAINQYRETIKMWGAGIYAHDSYFKAPIFIGSDFTMLIFAIPMATLTFIKARKSQSIEHFIRSFGVICLLLYYSASLAFGVTYNYLHLAYIALFSLCFFGVWLMLVELHALEIRQEKICLYPFTKGMKIFLVIAGISLFVAWLPDIITSILNKTSLDLIEVYTTEITYVLDMGIISPLMFITYHQMKHGKFIGYVLIKMIFKICMIIGIMLPIQSVFQMLAGVSIPIPALITKVLIFVLLAFFAAIFDYRLKRDTKYAEGII